MSIQGGNITATGPYGGIGSGDVLNGGISELRSLTFSGSAVLTCDATETGRFPVTAFSIVLADASLVFRTPRNRLFGNAPSRQGELNLTILYGTETSNGAEPVSLLNATSLQIGNFTLPAQGLWTFCVSGEGLEQWFESGLVEVKSLLTTVSGQGNYSIFAEHPLVSGHLRPSNEASFVVSSSPAFYTSAQVIRWAHERPR
jgi:hypothetical protein